MNALEKFEGTADDTQGIFTHFEKYLTHLLKRLIEKQAAEENAYAS